MLLEGAAKQSGLAVKQLLAQAPAKSRPNGSSDQAFGFTEKSLTIKSMVRPDRPIGFTIVLSWGHAV